MRVDATEQNSAWQRSNSVHTRRRFNVYNTLIRRRRRRMDVLDVLLGTKQTHDDIGISGVIRTLPNI